MTYLISLIARGFKLCKGAKRVRTLLLFGTYIDGIDSEVSAFAGNLKTSMLSRSDSDVVALSL